MARSLTSRLPGRLRKRVDDATAVGKRTSDEVIGSIIRNGWPTSVRGRSLAIMNSVFLHLHPIRTRPDAIKMTYTFGLGGISFFLFILLTITGVLLMFYYVPSVDRAWQTMHDIQSLQPFGFLLRNMHRWAAHGMVITVFLHMIRVFYTGSYKPPREFNWVIGTLLFFLTIFLSYTGYLLPWDQLALWAVTVGYEIARATPAVGDEVSFLIFGGYQLGPDALLRFYAAHCLLLPLAAGFLLPIHFLLIQEDGGISGPL